MTMYWRTGLILWLAFLVACVAPLPAPEDSAKAVSTPDRYQVVWGDTLIAIAWRYGLDYRDIAAWNRLKSPDVIYAGQTLRLRPPGVVLTPEPSSPADSQPVQTAKPASAPKKSSPKKTTESVASKQDWRWPIKGQVVRRFKPDVPGGKGIRIKGELGEPVRAASLGEVVYSGSGLPGYGKLIIVKHPNNLFSAYGYLQKIDVKEGDRVETGQKIAELGTSNENRSMLHFEIRKNGTPVNPLRYLPG